MDKNIWVVDDDESIRWVLEKGLGDNGMDVQTFDSANKVIKKLETENPQLILTDIRMPGPSGIDLLDKVKELRPEIPVIIMTAHSDLDSAVESYEHGAWEYLPKPFDIDEAVSMVQRATASEDLLKKRQSILKLKLSVRPLPCRKFFEQLVSFQTPIQRYYLLENPVLVKN